MQDVSKESNAGKESRRYAFETRQRMARTISDLSAIRLGGARNLNRVLRRVRQQETASRVAGFRGISELCFQMVDCASDGHCGDRQWLAAVAATLLDACQAVDLHADAVAKTLIRPDGEEARCRDDGESTGNYADGDDAEPHAAARAPPPPRRRARRRPAGQAAMS